jgi:predicted metal-dependent enzyme (double-stranded beta helix superfamily)
MTNKVTPLDPELQQFIDACQECVQSHHEAADCVTAIAPQMLKLLAGGRRFLKPEHLRTDPDHYARNAIYIAEDDCLSLFVLVWKPGQWTPVHDHGTWGVVGVVEGILEERNFITTQHDLSSNRDIDLLKGGSILLTEGAVTTFVPNPDHIHKTGVPESRNQAVTLHLYGRELSNFHVYDLEARTRRFIDVTHNESLI